MDIQRIQLIQGKGELNPQAGNYFSGKVLGTLPRNILPKNFHTLRSDAIFDRDILLTQIGLLCNGRTDFNDVELYKGDRLFTSAYRIDRLPSEATLRQRLDNMPREKTHDSLRRLNLELLRKCKSDFGRVKAGMLELVPVDMDVSPMDNSASHKQGSSHTYKGVDGFAPLFSYIGLEGYALDFELREGKQHCQKGTPQTITRVLAQIRGLGLAGQCLIRMDSGNDAAENLDLLQGEHFIIKRTTFARSPLNSGWPWPGGWGNV
ncbi:MAG: transposase [Opitutae bacterium]